MEIVRECDRYCLWCMAFCILTLVNDIYTCEYNSCGECSVNDKKQEIYPTNKLTRKKMDIDDNYEIFYLIAGYHATLIVVQQ